MRRMRMNIVVWQTVIWSLSKHRCHERRTMAGLRFHYMFIIVALHMIFPSRKVADCRIYIYIYSHIAYDGLLGPEWPSMCLRRFTEPCLVQLDFRTIIRVVHRTIMFAFKLRMSICMSAASLAAHGMVKRGINSDESGSLHRCWCHAWLGVQLDLTQTMTYCWLLL